MAQNNKNHPQAACDEADGQAQKAPCCASLPPAGKASCHACHHKSVPRSEDTQRLLQNRLNRMVGQLNGISKMLDDNRYCGDILMQISAVESALQSFGYLILKEHMETCVVEEVQKGNTQIVNEAFELMKKLK